MHIRFSSNEDNEMDDMQEQNDDYTDRSLMSMPLLIFSPTILSMPSDDLVLKNDDGICQLCSASVAIPKFTDNELMQMCNN
uniref:Uncharacterized protein n=1 Tax=Romanomermis culicivorax TaxID=13658 RepID=A0A915HLU4_ROMCU